MLRKKEAVITVLMMSMAMVGVGVASPACYAELWGPMAWRWPTTPTIPVGTPVDLHAAVRTPSGFDNTYVKVSFEIMSATGVVLLLLLDTVPVATGSIYGLPSGQNGPYFVV